MRSTFDTDFLQGADLHGFLEQSRGNTITLRIQRWLETACAICISSARIYVVTFSYTSFAHSSGSTSLRISQHFGHLPECPQDVLMEAAMDLQIVWKS